MPSIPNPIRFVIAAIGQLLARFDVIDAERARRTTDLAWPRIVTGLARMSKNAVDVAMVGIAVGATAIAGVGFASAYWGLAFALGGGLSSATIALVSQRYGANAYQELDQAVRSSTLLIVAATLPLAAAFWLYADGLIGLLSSNADAIALGGTYLQILSFGVPFAGINLVASRVLVGGDDSWTPMVIRAGGAIMNIVLNAILIFALDLGVAGAAIGTVLSNVAVTAAFTLGLVRGSLPGIGTLPITINPIGAYADLDTFRQLLEIGIPVIGRRLVWTAAEFPMLGIVDIFGPPVVAAYVIARRIWMLMNTPGWGFNLASTSLVGQSLGTDDERLAETYGREIIRFGVATYLLFAAIVFVFAEPIVVAFVGDATDPTVPVAVALVYAACIAVIIQGIAGGAAGPLDASGDTNWPLYSQVVGLFVLALPLAYLGATTSLGLIGLYLAFIAETTAPAVINYYRFRTGKWKRISQAYRPEQSPGDD